MTISNLAHFGNGDFHIKKIENMAIDSFTSKELSKHRVLVLNANRYSQARHTEFLENMGIVNIDYTNTVNKLIDLTNQHPYSIILFEVISITQSTSAICKIIRDSYKNKNTMILASTYYTQQSTHDLCIQCGMNGLIIKPFIFNKYKKSIYFYINKSNK